MTSNINETSFENLSLCVYIGNTSSFDDQTLINYCSQYGRIVSCSIDNCPRDKRSFCDFRIVEFATKQQLEYFLNISTHKIGSIILDVKLYKNLLDNFEILNIDRKLFIGPILNSNDINIIIQFYKLIDLNLQYCLSRHDKQTYILIEFSNREYIRTIIQQKTIPKTIDNQLFTIHTAIHPKELISKKVSIRNNQYQICVNGLNDQITENILIDYFDKRASVVACHILSTDPKCAIIEFENEKSVRKLLDIPIIRLHGANLSLNKVPDHLRSVLPSSNINNTEEYTNDDIDQLLEASGPKVSTSNFVSFSHSKRNQSFLTVSSPVQQMNINQQQQSNLFSNSQPSSLITKSISVPSPDITECGWASPPRNVIINNYPLVNQPPERLSSKPNPTTMNINTDPTYQSIVIETDTKPIKKVTNNILHFVEQFQNEIDQIKDEYMRKFTKDRTSIEHEINQLINDEQIEFDKAKRYLYEYRRYSAKSYDNNNNKRKHN